MKNLYNFGFVVLLLVILGCKCQLPDQSKTPTTSSPSTSSSPAASTSPATTDKKDGLTLEKFNRIKNGMSYSEVKDIIGSEGAQIASSGEGKYKVESYKWDGENFSYILVTFMGEKMYSKNQNGMK